MKYAIPVIFTLCVILALTPLAKADDTSCVWPSVEEVYKQIHPDQPPAGYGQPNDVPGNQPCLVGQALVFTADNQTEEVIIWKNANNTQARSIRLLNRKEVVDSYAYLDDTGKLTVYMMLIIPEVHYTQIELRADGLGEEQYVQDMPAAAKLYFTRPGRDQYGCDWPDAPGMYQRLLIEQGIRADTAAVMQTGIGTGSWTGFDESCEFGYTTFYLASNRANDGSYVFYYGVTYFAQKLDNGNFLISRSFNDNDNAIHYPWFAYADGDDAVFATYFLDGTAIITRVSIGNGLTGFSPRYLPEEFIAKTMQADATRVENELDLPAYHDIVTELHYPYIVLESGAVEFMEVTELSLHPWVCLTGDCQTVATTVELSYPVTKTLDTYIFFAEKQEDSWLILGPELLANEGSYFEVLQYQREWGYYTASLCFNSNIAVIFSLDFGELQVTKQTTSTCAW